MTVPTPSRSPFDPTPTTPGAGPGCARPMVIGCVVVLVLLGILAVFAVMKAPELLDWAFGQLESQVEARLPDELSEEERRRLDDAFERFREAAREGELEPAELQRVQGRLMAIAGKQQGEVTREEILELIEAMEAAARPPAPEEEAGTPI